ncbi:U32 family peptidase [Sneathia sanguinegens]|uniref:peptidase U32 family protein n=1 Tax=Sneathia sanguinegens TaxID=40543 RepID=UPI00258C7F88|nr:U32 family peptidase [Sneathia sanguinegens]MDU4651914.1 U32 family peptidase [Sneathia sanguinegens]MDU7496720.1 U32 family peptidase [Sneathia sanguinegens]
MNKVELLSPAGNMEKLKEAFHFGADACYIGGGAFNLRGMSANFRNKELEEAIEYAHSLGKKIYVTLNIFAHNKDIDYMPRFIKFLASVKADGVIVSDLGVFSMVKEYAPSLDIHISTQANSINWATVKMWRDMGATRVILAREMTLKEIKEIKDRVPGIQIEAFIHGAMCMAYSGRCLLSNYFTNRDANRGVCAQDCRWKYKIVAEDHEATGAHDIIEDNEGTYILNAKDLCTIEFIDKIIEAGVDSLKIEGRMKSIYYNSTVTKQYREAIDCYYTGNYKYNPKWKYELQTISHRLYSKGFFFGKTSQEDQNYDTNISYSQTYQLVANVMEKVAENKYKIYIRNKLDTSKELELIRPKSDPIKFYVNNFLNTKNDEFTQVVNPNTIAIIETDIEMGKYDLIRIKLPVGQAESDLDTENI